MKKKTTKICVPSVLRERREKIFVFLKTIVIKGFGIKMAIKRATCSLTKRIISINTCM